MEQERETELIERDVHGERGPILVPVEGPGSSRALLPVVRAVAGIWQAPPHLFYITPAPLPEGVLLEALGLTASDLEGLVLDQQTGDPAAVILEAVRVRAVSLVIMATHGWTAGPAAMLGHVVEAVLRGSHCPLLLVGQEAGKRFVPEHAALSRIVLPLDGSLETATALVAVAPLIARPEAIIDVLHVVPSESGVTTPAGAFSVPRYLDQPYHEWAGWRREFAARFRDGLIQEPAGVHVAVGEPGNEIVAAAEQYRSDLIVLAWKGVVDAGRARTLRTVLRDAPCPVLIVRVEPSSVRPPAVAATTPAPIQD